MKKLLLLNTSINYGSTGRIAEEIGQAAIANGYEGYFGYGRFGRESKLNLIQIGNPHDTVLHGVKSLLFDNQGFGSRLATRKFIEEVKRIKPDIINLHNIHGYYLNIEILFNYLAKSEIPIVWTLHDCWPFTGHCSFFDRYHCMKWKTGCYDCPNSKGYPMSLLLDHSSFNYSRKKELFNNPKNITFVPVCNWMAENIKESFLGGYPVETIYNGVDIKTFRPRFQGRDDPDCLALKRRIGVDADAKVMLGVASTWDRRKGLVDFVRLRNMMDKRYAIILVGLSRNQINSLPKGIIGISRTESVNQLAELYSLADVFVNPTFVDNFPTTNIEALACGTPVITYNTGGSAEAIDHKTGIVVELGNVQKMKSAIEDVVSCKDNYSEECRKRAVEYFNKNDRFADYVSLFDRLANRTYV